MGKLKSLKEKRATIYTSIDELRQAADGREMTAEEQQRWDTMLSDYDKADKAVEAEERYQEIQRRQAEEQIARRDAAIGQQLGQEYRQAFGDYILNGAMGMSPESRAAIERSGISGLSGGVIIPKSIASEIEVALKSYGGMLEAGSIITTSHGGDLILPTINDTTAKATIVTEYDQSTKRAPAFGSVTLKAHTYRTPIVPLSQELLQDSAFNLDALLTTLLTDAFGRGINEDLTNGNGTGKPTGVVNAAVDCGATPAAASIKLDDIIDLIKSVNSVYARNGKFMFNRNTLWELAKIKDQSGRYIWQEAAKDGSPATLFGKQYILNDDIADIGAGKTSVLFGDFSKYKIRLVQNFRVIRLNELLAEYLSVGLYGFARVDGNLLDAGTNPIKKLVHAKS